MHKLIFLLPLFLIGCLESKKKQNSISEDSSDLGIQKNSISILDVMNDSLFIWHGGSSFAITFEEENLYYFFYLSCVYTFPTKVNLNKEAIVAYWDLKPNCIYDIGLKKTFGLKRYPKIGKPFVSFFLENDSTLNAIYEFPEWVEKFNAYNKEEYFPKQFILQNLH